MDDLDWSLYPTEYADQVFSADCELVESQRGLWIWRGNQLLGHVARQPQRALTTELMKEELSDLQRRIDVALAGLPEPAEA
jgi:hypothetical protein